jgi:hypothetical protein
MGPKDLVSIMRYLKAEHGKDLFGGVAFMGNLLWGKRTPGERMASRSVQLRGCLRNA